MCCKIDQIKAAPKGRHVTRVRPTRCCCKHTYACYRILKLRVSHKGQRLQRIARPPAAAGTHMCVAEQTNAELHRGSRFTKVWPTICCWGHTHVCCRTGEIRVAPKGQRLQRFGRAVVAVSTHTHVCHCAQHSRVTNVSPTKRCREHTHTCVCCRNQGCTQGPKFYQGFADQLLLRAYTCVLQSGSLKGRSQGSPDQLLLRAYTCVSKKMKSRRSQWSKCYKGSAEKILLLAYACVLQGDKTRVFHTRVNGYKGLPDHLLLWAHTCVLQNTSMQSCTEGQGLRRFGRPNAPTDHTHVCCRMYQFRVVPKRQGLQRRADQLLL